MKQTAVEWLENEFKEAHKMFGGIDTNWIKRFDQAKAMEKKQIVDAYYQIGKDHQDMIFPIEKNAEQYYNETYESNT